MRPDREKFLATAIVIFTGSVWGLYWYPVRTLAVSGLPGAWGTAAITLSATLILLPLAVVCRRQLMESDWVALTSIALGGAAFALYSIGFVYGRVAIIILLYFLTPVWSTLIGRYVLGWRASPMRVLAIVLGLAGLGVMLGSDGSIPKPEGIGEWLALAAGVLWSVATTGMRVKSTLQPVLSAFVFALGGTVTAAVFALVMAPLPAFGPTSATPLIGISLATGALWWVGSVASLMWATVRLEPARVGILLMTEVVVGAISAALMAGEHLGALELTGGALVMISGIFEIAAKQTLAREA